MAIRNLLDALFPLYGLPYAQAAAELEMAAAAATVLARFFRRAERECAVKLPRAKSAPPSPCPAALLLFRVVFTVLSAAPHIPFTFFIDLIDGNLLISPRKCL